MPDSIFTQIIDRKLPATIHFEDDEFIAIDNIYPKAPIHVLIVSKKAYASLEALDLGDDAFHAKLLRTARQVAHELCIADNYKLFMNVGEKVQGIQHLHLHLMGGWDKDAQERLFNE